MTGRGWSLPGGMALALCLAAVRIGADDPPVYRFLVADVSASPGDRIRVTIQGEHAESVQGFSLALRYPAAGLAIEEIHIRETILEAVGTDYFTAKVSPQDGTLVVGVLVDAEPPFTGALVPAIGRPLDFVHLEVKVAPSATEDLPLRFEDGLSTPPIVNLFAVDNQPVPVTELGGGTVLLGSSGGGAVFVRGDCNSDSKVDVSDPIIVLSSIFTGQERLLCEVAADANDDEEVDVSDPIFLLQYLFVHGASPPPPDVGGGVDPTSGGLGCVVPPR